MLRFHLALLCGLRLLKDIAAISVAKYRFTLADPTTMAKSQYDVAATSWRDVETIQGCAHKTMTLCPASRGFLFESSTGACTPVLWLREGQAPGAAASGRTSSEKLYLSSSGVCPHGFQARVYGEDGAYMTCVTKITNYVPYEEATSRCQVLGGHLASVKTAAKLAMVAALAEGRDLWIGMDDLVEHGTYVWQEDHQQLTSAQRDAVFGPGEPNNNPKEDCVNFWAEIAALNDHFCYGAKEALCETLPQPATC